MKENFVTAALPQTVFPPLFNCYTDGGTFGFHIDNAVRQVRGTAVNQVKDVHNMVVTAGTGVPTSGLILGSA